MRSNFPFFPLPEEPSATPQKGCRVPKRGVERSGLAQAFPAGLVLAALGFIAAQASAFPVPGGSRIDDSLRLVRPVAVFGTDDRIALPASRTALRASIGLLYEQRSHSICTAFCAGDDIVATAAHCVFRTADERAPRLSGFSFRLQPPGQPGASVRIAGTGHNGEAQHVAAGTSKLSVRPPIDAASDWALLKLAQPVCKGHALAVSRQPEGELIKLSAAQRVYQVSFHRDFGNWELAYGAPCAIRRSFEGADWDTIAKDFSDAGHVILHTCDTGGASSGSPMLIDGPSGPEVVGINVGTYLQARVLTQQGQVVHRYKSETVANTAVGASAFRGTLEALTRAELIESGREIRDLQRLLAAEGHYTGSLDGVYGVKLNAAIRAFEHAEGRSETGLATTSLLKRLTALDLERRGRTAGARPAIETGSVGSHRVTGGKGRLP
jgi:protease YdgD